MDICSCGDHEEKRQDQLCIDPKPLSQALKRNHYPLPTIEDILCELSQAKCFSILYAKNGFWQILLDEPNSYLTPFAGSIDDQSKNIFSTC